MAEFDEMCRFPFKQTTITELGVLVNGCDAIMELQTLGGIRMGFIKNKEWYKSKTIQAATVAFVVAVLTVMGVNPQITGAIGAVASVFGIYGRFDATQELKS